MSDPTFITQTTPIITYFTDTNHDSHQIHLHQHFRVLSANSIEDLSTQIEQQEPVLILLDDVEICSQIADGVIAPILMITSTDEVDAAIAAGATDIFTQGYDHPLLTQRIDALLKAYTLYRFEHVPVMVHSTHSNGHLRYVNQKWQSVMGYTRDEVLGKRPRDLMDEMSQLRIQDQDAKYWTHEGTVRDFWVRFITKSGEPLDVLLDSDIQTNSNGKQYSLTFCRDISDLKQAEMTLLESEQQIQSILGALSDSIMLMSRDGVYLRVLTPNQQMVDMPDGGLVGKSIIEVAGEKGSERILSMIEDVLTTQQPDSMEYRVPAQNSHKKAQWFYASFSPIPERDEVVVVIRNITEQKNIEESLRHSERRYRMLIDAANDGILLVDIHSATVLEANPQIGRMLSYTREELLGMSMDDIELPDAYDESTSNFGATNQLIIESYYQRRDGSRIPVETSSRIIQHQGKPALVCFVRDITERKRALRAEQYQRHMAEVLRDTAAAFNVAITYDDVMDTLIENVARVIDYHTVNILMVDDDGMGQVVRLRGYDEIGITPDTITIPKFAISESSNLSEVVATKKPYVIYDTRTEDIQWADPSTSWIRSMVSVPIVIENVVRGFINVDSPEPNTFTEELAEQLQIFADQAAVALQNAILLEKTQNYAEELAEEVDKRTHALRDANQQLKEQIMQRREIEEQLDTERSLLKTLIETIPDAIYIKDAERRFVMANAATLESLHVDSLDDVVGKTDFDLMPHDEASQYIDDEEHLLATGEPMMRRMHMYRDLQGQMQYIVYTKLPLRDGDGDITGIIGINHDITDLKRTEERLNHVLTGARCLLWYATISKVDEHYQWELQITNEQAAQTFLPIDLADYASYTDAWEAAIVDEDMARRQTVFETHLMFGQHNYTYEFRCELHDAAIHWLAEDVQIRPIGEDKWQAVGVVTDITDLKLVQEELKQLNADLERRVHDRTVRLSQANDDLKQEITERKRAEEREREQRILSDTLRNTVTLLNSTLDQSEIFHNILQGIRSIIPHDAACILLLEDYTLTIASAKHYPRPMLGSQYDMRQMSNLLASYQSGEPVMVDDISTFEDWQDDDLVGTFYSNLSAPIPLGDDVIGFLSLDSRAKANFTQQHAEWLKAFASQAGNAIRNARMVDEIRHQALRFEQQVIERTAELEVQRALLNAILDAMRDGVIFQDLDDDVQYINRAMQSITGYSDTAWFSGEAQEQINTESVEERAEQFQKVQISLDKRGFWQGETILRRANGDIFDASLVRTEVQDKFGERTGIVTVLRDISQEKALEAQKARFIASASHELRTPITNIKTRLFLIRRRPEQVTEHLEVITSVVTMMQKLVETMFDISRFERGVIALDIETVNVQELLQDILQHHDAEAETKEIALYETMPDETIYMEADRYRVAQIITNLLKNALNYTPPRGSIRVAVQERDDNVEIHVQDTGKGIAKEHLEHLFKPFYRGQQDNLGTGLGLSISTDIAESHGGEIRVTSEVGKGSHFVVILPKEQPKG